MKNENVYQRRSIRLSRHSNKKEIIKSSDVQGTMRVGPRRSICNEVGNSNFIDFNKSEELLEDVKVEPDYISVPPSQLPERLVKISEMKSPADRHSGRRQRVGIDIKEKDDNEFELYYNSDDNSESDLKIQRILASKSKPRSDWKKICDKINTTEVDNGSRWFQDDNKYLSGCDKLEEKFLVKWSDLSYIHCSWESEDDLIDQVENAKTHLKNFYRKNYNGYLYDADVRGDGEYFDPSFVEIERILEITLPNLHEDEYNESALKQEKKRTGIGGDWGIIYDKSDKSYENGTGREFLVKWVNVAYSECSYEYERDLLINYIDYEQHVEHFLKRKNKPSKTEMTKLFKLQEDEKRHHYKIFGDGIKDNKAKAANIVSYKKKLEKKLYKNGGQLRDYQAEGITWMMSNYVNKRSSILADEMGLGKTIQTALYVNNLVSIMKIRGPFLIIAPLSTIPHWQREFSVWTDLNIIVYHGSARDREIIREFEFAFESDRPCKNISFNQNFLKQIHNRSSPKWIKTWMVQVVITTPEMFVTDDHTELTALNWELLVVDEAHRLKNHSSKLAVNLRNEKFQFQRNLLLTGTPIQNNMNELWTLMNIIDSKMFSSVDEFMKKYGDIQCKEHVDELHNEIRPYILRRLKEDVEKSMPPKEETIIEVELTILQKQYYRALYERNIKFLHRNSKKKLDGPSINNLAMQLRKCCNHPFLLKGVESELRTEFNKTNTQNDEVDFLVKASGKLVLIDKLLPRLKDDGHRVLIFSQFKIMLDILEDYFALREFKTERIDGSITGKTRQKAIDRFQGKGDMNASFIMLLSTRAGGVGINLTAADTCIIFDSDWNPQNDLQAQARCHRIGQKKCVKIYRLLSSKTYEMQMFHMSSMKMGLDQAVLQGIEAGVGNGEGAMTKEEVEKLLRHGAYDMFSDEKTGVSEKESNDFLAQSIDSILERRTKKLVHDNVGSHNSATGSTFSKASFKALKGISDDISNVSGKNIDIDDPEFWKKVVGEPICETTEDLSRKKRVRKKANYNESFLDESITEVKDYQYRKKSVDSDYDGSNIEKDIILKSTVFSLSDEKILYNELLQRIKEKLRIATEELEKCKWGRKSASEWSRNDVDVMFKHLLRFGYGNIKWSDFIDILVSNHRNLSNNYTDDEIIRMCWSLALVIFSEAVDDDVEDSEKRAKRLLMKRQEEEHDEYLHTSKSSFSRKERKVQLNFSFQKLWSHHIEWTSKALSDAIKFASTNILNNPKVYEVSINERNESIKNLNLFLLNTFNDSMWPVLQKRGWVVEICSRAREKRKYYIFHGHSHVNCDSIAEVLDVAQLLHPELGSTIESAILSAVTMLASTDNYIPIIESLDSITSRNINHDSLTFLLKLYAPKQLMYDRSIKRNKLPIFRKHADTLYFLQNAHYLVNMTNNNLLFKSISQDHLNKRITHHINLNLPDSIPHPLWKAIHDSVLIQAITKHGWIGSESRCRAITEDKTIKWGPPFDKGLDFEIQSHNKINLDDLKPVALRCAKLINSIKVSELKGFNLNQVTKVYGLNQCDINNGKSGNWVFNTTLLETKNVLEPVNQLCELPSRKKLLKRARIILTRKVTPKLYKESSDFSVPLLPDLESSPYQFSLLNLHNVCNTLLAELIRALLKLPKTSKWVKVLIDHADSEADLRYKAESTKKTLTKDTMNESSDFQRITKHLKFISRKFPLTRVAKNNLRAILGIDPIPPKHPDNSVFLVDKEPLKLNPFLTMRSHKHNSTVKSCDSLHTINRRDSAIGDIAINNAVSLGSQKDKLKIDQSRDSSLLYLTSIETLILSIVCSQGIPICTDDLKLYVNLKSQFHNFINITWESVGNVLEAAAEEWRNLSEKKILREEGVVSLGGYAPNIAKIQADVITKGQAFIDAQYLNKNPLILAKKTIMLLEAVRLRMGTIEKKTKYTNKTYQSLGPRVLQWNIKHLVKWAKSLDIIRDGCPISSTSADFIIMRPDIMTTASFDKKACRSVFCQISQQTRLRSIFIKHNKNIMKSLVKDAVMKSKISGDIWYKRPSWWDDKDNETFQDDFELLHGILCYGYGGFNQMLKQKTFSCRIANKSSHDSNKLYVENSSLLPVFTRTSAQERVNQLTRELSSIDDITDVMRIVNERKASKISERKMVTLGINGDLCNKSSSLKCGVQKEIDAFFKPSSDSIDNTRGLLLIDPINSSDMKGDTIARPGHLSSDKRKSLTSNLYIQSSPEKKIKFL